MLTLAKRCAVVPTGLSPACCSTLIHCDRESQRCAGCDVDFSGITETATTRLGTASNFTVAPNGAVCTTSPGIYGDRVLGQVLRLAFARTVLAGGVLILYEPEGSRHQGLWVTIVFMHSDVAGWRPVQDMRIHMCCIVVVLGYKHSLGTTYSTCNNNYPRSNRRCSLRL